MQIKVSLKIKQILSLIKGKQIFTMIQHIKTMYSTQATRTTVISFQFANSITATTGYIKPLTRTTLVALER